MANSFVPYVSTGVTTLTDVLTGQAGAQTTVIGMSIANTSNNPATVSVKYDADGTEAYMVKGCIILPGSALIPIGMEQKVVLREIDAIKVESDETVDVIVSVLAVS
jgi:hypothetical protein